MSDIAAVITRSDGSTGFVRRPLMVLGLTGLGVFALLTLYAAGHSYMPFDVSLERWIQGVSWGPLVTVFYWFDWLEGTRQYVAGIGVILVVSAFNWKNAPHMLFAGASTAVYTFTELTIQRPRPTVELVGVLKHNAPSDVIAGPALGLGSTALGLSIRLLSNPALARSR